MPDKRKKGKLARMVKDMLNDPEHLSESELKWVNDIKETAESFEHLESYTPRQEEVLRDIYKRFKEKFQEANKSDEIRTVESAIDTLKQEQNTEEISEEAEQPNNIIQGNFG